MSYIKQFGQLQPFKRNKVEQYLSLPEPRGLRCRAMQHVKIVCGTAHDLALQQFEEERRQENNQ